MSKVLFTITGGLLLLTLFAWGSLALAAPAVVSTPVASSLATATPVLAEADDPDLAAAAEVGLAAVTPVNPGTMTSQILTFNPDTSGPATVSLQIIKLDGTAVYTFPNFTIPANGAVLKKLPTTITSPFTGSAVVSSNKNIQAFVTNSNATNTARDEYEGTLSPNAALTLPLVRHLATDKQNSLIAVQNTGSTPQDITMNLYNADGSSAGTQTANGVKPLASTYFNTNTLFPSGTFTGSAQITADGTTPLAASIQARYLKDTASFRALSSADANTTLYVPFVERRRNSTNALLSWSEIFVRNHGNAATDITAQFYSTNGVLVASVTRPAVPANGLAQFLTNTPEFTGLTTAVAYYSGWVKVTAGQLVSLYAFDAQTSGTRLFGVNGISATQLGVQYACGDTLRTSTQTSKISILNTGNATASVIVKLYKTTGAQAGSKTVSVGANKVVTVSAGDAAFTNAGTTFEGLATATSNGAQIAVSMYTPYSGAGGITAYTCSRLQ